MIGQDCQTHRHCLLIQEAVSRNISRGRRVVNSNLFIDDSQFLKSSLRTIHDTYRGQRSWNWAN